jgi:protein associated with RNAse G/E
MKIQKKNLNGDVVFQYDGEVVKREEGAIVLEAFFGRDDMAFMNVTLKRGDRFVETFYTDRWYNIFEIFDRDTGEFKGWYCNIGKPAVIEDEVVSYVDLALDLWVAPDGTQTILDEDELLELNLDDDQKRHVYAGMRELQELLKTKNAPS